MGITKTHIFFFLLAALISLTSCEEEYHVDVSNFEASLVVDGVFVADDPWTIKLTKTYHALTSPEEEDLWVTDAEVIIGNKDGKYICQLDYVGDGIYKNGSIYPQANRSYTLMINHQEFESVRAEATCPDKPEIVIEKSCLVQQEDSPGLELNFEIKQSGASNHFYMWEVLPIDDDADDTDLFQFVSTPDVLNLTNISFFDARNIGGTIPVKDVYYNLNNTLDSDTTGYLSSTPETVKSVSSIVKDEDVKSNSIDLLTGTNGGNADDKTGDASADLYKMNLVTLSRDLYDHYVSILDYYKKYPKINSVSHYQSIQSNVKGGYGVFAGVNKTTVNFR